MPAIRTSAFAADAENLLPKQHYLIAFSNGDMNNSWRAAFVNSMEQWGKKFKSVGPGVDYVWTNSAGDPPVRGQRSNVSPKGAGFAST